jgi:hypothetical protein
MIKGTKILFDAYFTDMSASLYSLLSASLLITGITLGASRYGAFDP